jgi:membrane associated rhomboid family serine protease
VELLRIDVDRALVEEWCLVLTAEGLSPSIEHTSSGFAVLVPRDELVAADRALDSYELENPRGAGPQTASPEHPDRIGQLECLGAGVVSLAMLAFFGVTGPRNAAVDWFATGSADSARILDGELWRTVTALCLHADLGHVVANALFGGVFLAAVFGGFGVGFGIALTLLAGAGGNLANAIFQGPDHISVGASTAVFGAVGLLAGRGVAQRIRRGELGLRSWVPIAAGFALIAMIGTGERTDIWAHLFGFLTGGFLGIPASLAWPKPGWPVQLGTLAIAIVGLLYAWQRALA